MPSQATRQAARALGRFLWWQQPRRSAGTRTHLGIAAASVSTTAAAATTTTTTPKKPQKQQHPSQTSTGPSADRLSRALLATDPQELERAYDQWATQYDADMKELSGQPLEDVGIVASKVVARHFLDLPEACQDILDFGCGTGTAGQYWKDKCGLDTSSIVDGCDLSQGMLDVTASRNCYRRLIKADFDRSNCPANAYDIVHASGVFAPGQAPPSAFDEFIRLLKKGGHAVFTVRCGYYDSEEGKAHRQRLEELVDQKQWELVAQTIEPYLPKEGITAYAFVMKKL